MSQNQIIGAQISMDLEDLQDVAITSPTDSQVLTYIDSVWVNADSSGGGGGGAVPPQIIQLSSNIGPALDGNLFEQWTSAVSNFSGYTSATYITYDDYYLQFAIASQGVYQIDINAHIVLDQYATAPTTNYEIGTEIQGVDNVDVITLTTTRHLIPLAQTGGDPSAIPRTNDIFDRHIIATGVSDARFLLGTRCLAASNQSVGYTPTLTLVITRLGNYTPV